MEANAVVEEKELLLLLLLLELIIPALKPMVVDAVPLGDAVVVARVAAAAGVGLLLLLVLGEAGLKKASVGATRRRSKRADACRKERMDAGAVMVVVAVGRVAVMVTCVCAAAAACCCCAWDDHGLGRSGAAKKNKKFWGCDARLLTMAPVRVCEEKSVVGSICLATNEASA